MKAVEILTKKNIKRTSCREGIIDVIINTGGALSENEIREKLAGNYDRTTFYRSFKTLEDNKIIHKIVIDNQLVKYALDNSITQKKEHAHFYCSNCHSVLCLDSTPVNNFIIPDGFMQDETKIIIKGTCANCRKINKPK